MVRIVAVQATIHLIVRLLTGIMAHGTLRDRIHPRRGVFNMAIEAVDVGIVFGAPG